jgi:hypothetical protein
MVGGKNKSWEDKQTLNLNSTFSSLISKLAYKSELNEINHIRHIMQYALRNCYFS